MSLSCDICGKRAYSDRCMQHKDRKPLNKLGKKGKEIDKWVRTVARPHLINKYGPVCAECHGTRCSNKQLDVDHILGKGSHPGLRMDLTNVQLLGRYPCHDEKTRNIT